MNLPVFRSISLGKVAVVAAVAATTAGLTAQTGPYSTDSFEAHRFVLAPLGGEGFQNLTAGQDGWMLFDDQAYPADYTAAMVQTSVVRSGRQAVKFDAARMSPGCYGELRRNAFFSLTTGVLEIELDFMIQSSSRPSEWGFYTQPAPHPQTCQMRWWIKPNGQIEFLSTPNRQLVTTNHFVSKDVWHHMRSVVDILGDRNEIYLDGTLVGSGRPIGVYASLPDHGFTQIELLGAGNDAMVFDNFTVRERTAPHGLSVDLPRLPIGLRSTAMFHLAGGAALAGRTYVLLGSASGTTPGTRIGQVTLPLNVDGFFGMIGSNLGTALLPGFAGVLGADGGATASFDTQVPVPSALVGTNLDFAYLTLRPFDAVSEAVRVGVTAR
ncbi:MAG: hypothetical protein R3F56_07585 [Planctomycetota bacterium]